MKLTKNKYFIPSLFIILVSIVICLPIFIPDFNIQYDDGIQHICRIIGTSQSIKEGQIFPVIMSKLCNGFGYSWNLFYSPFTAYMPLIFRLVGCSFEMCLKLSILSFSILSGYSMYFFMRKFLKGKLDENKINLIAILAAVLYILSPYRLNDMYLRVAISELASFIFIPIIFNGLYTIINLKEKSFLLIIGASGMLLTHSMLTVYVVLFCIIYLIVNIKKLDTKIIIRLIYNAIIILLLTSFYWVPLLESKIATNYEVFNQQHMVRWDAMIKLKPNVLELFMKINGRHMYGLGTLVIIGSVLSFTVIKDLKEKSNYILFLVLGIISTIMTLDFFPFEKLPSFFTMMQFSFRMLEFASFFLVVVSSISLGIKIEKINIYNTLFLTVLSILILLPCMMNLPKGEYYSEEKLIEGIKITNNTGRVHAGCASLEYLPTKAFENKEYIANREDVPIILEGNNCYITNYNKNGTNCNFEIQVNTPDNSQITVELPYIYYIGYNIKYIDEFNNEQRVYSFESKNGFVAINVPNQNIKIEVEYTGSILMKISYIISLITFIGVVILRKLYEF